MVFRDERSRTRNTLRSVPYVSYVVLCEKVVDKRPTVLDESFLFDKGRSKVRTTLDVASLEAVPLNLVGAVAQVLLGVLKEGPADGLLPLDVMVTMGICHGCHQGVDDDGREPHGDPLGML